MSTTVASSAATRPIRPLRLSTIVAVELRKMTDTRSGAALLVATAVATLAVLVWKVAHASVETSFDNYSAGAATMVAFLMPIVGLLAMTSEWTQRTALTTFTLAPRRIPVIAAKYLATLALSLTAVGVALVMAAIACVIGGAVHGPADFDGWLGDVRYAVLFVLLQVTMAAAFGALAANTPAALSAFLLAPTVWAMLADGALRPVAPWLDIFEAYGRLSSEQPFDDLSRTVVAVTVWVVVPAALGLVGSVRREVR